MSNEIIRVANLVLPAQESFSQNQLSHNNCIAAGERLLQRVKTDGMSDELDQEIAIYIDKTRRTARMMNERRSPITKMFDEIRTQFTSLEADLDVAGKHSIPHALQDARNQFAKQKHEAEQQRKREELLRQQKAEAERRRNEEIVANFLKGLRWTISNAITELHATFNTLTLQNEKEVRKDIGESMPLDHQMLETSISSMQSFTDINALREEVNSYLAWYNDTKRQLISNIPARLRELRELADADADEAARLAEEQRLRCEQEARQREQQRKHAEEVAAQLSQQRKQEADLQASFDAVSIEQQYKPKSSVTKRIEITDAAAIPQIIAFWWSREGSQLSLIDLCKLFKKQITFAEKLANKEEIFIESTHIRYTDEVKAK